MLMTAGAVGMAVLELLGRGRLDLDDGGHRVVLKSAIAYLHRAQ